LGAGPATAAGPGNVSFWASANTTISSRSASIKIADQAFAVMQNAPPGANAPPKVAITSPADGASFAAGSNGPVTADATDSDGTVTRVDFHAGSTLIGNDTSAPYELAWMNPAAGTYTLTARAVDNLGASTTSTPVRVTITSGGDTLPPPWTTQDIGAVGIAGSASYTSGTFNVSGSGADIWGTADGFRFVYRSLTGDGSIVARVVSIENTDVWAKAGVMIRETLNANSRHASMFVTPAKGLAFQRRTSTGGTSASTAGPLSTAPKWVRVQRTGSTFTAAWSNDATSWTTVGSVTISMGAATFVGFAVTSHNNATSADAVFDSVR
jgi:hypothetical protein